MNYASYQTVPAPEGGISNARPEGQSNVTINAQPGAMSVTENGITTQRPQSVTANDFTTGSSGILSRARTAQGAPSLNGIQATDIITVDGFELTVAQAEQLGMVGRNANGQYVEVQGGVEAAKAEPKQDAPVDDDAQAFTDPQAEAALVELANSVAPAHHVAAIQDVLKTGEISELTISRAASEAGQEPSAVAEKANNVVESFRTQAITAVQSWGSDDPEAFFQWAHQEKPNTLREAMQNQGMNRSVAGYQSLYSEYVASFAERDPDFIMQTEFGSGVTARKDGKTVVLNIPGRGEMTWRAAIKAGFIRVHGA